MRYVYFVTFFVVVLTVSILGFRGQTSTRPPLQIFPDMDQQPKYKPQAESAFFTDGRASRPQPAGTVPFGRLSSAADPDYLAADTEFYMGKTASGDWVEGIPSSVTLNAQFMERGRERYVIYCAPCHGALGDGNGITKQYGMGATPSYHDERLRTMADGELFDIITHGKGNMLSYSDKTTPQDRWAIISYVRALQRAENGTVEDVPASHKPELGLK